MSENLEVITLNFWNALWKDEKINIPISLFSVALNVLVTFVEMILKLSLL